MTVSLSQSLATMLRVRAGGLAGTGAYGYGGDAIGLDDVLVVVEADAQARDARTFGDDGEEDTLGGAFAGQPDFANGIAEDFEIDTGDTDFDPDALHFRGPAKTLFFDGSGVGDLNAEILGADIDGELADFAGVEGGPLLVNLLHVAGGIVAPECDIQEALGRSWRGAGRRRRRRRSCRRNRADDAAEHAARRATGRATGTRGGAARRGGGGRGARRTRAEEAAEPAARRAPGRATGRGGGGARRHLLDRVL